MRDEISDSFASYLRQQEPSMDPLLTSKISDLIAGKVAARAGSPTDRTGRQAIQGLCNAG